MHSNFKFIAFNLWTRNFKLKAKSFKSNSKALNDLKYLLQNSKALKIFEIELKEINWEQKVLSKIEKF